MPVFVDRYRKPNSRYPNVSFKPSGIHATQSSPDSGDAALECATKCSPAASGGRLVTTIHTAPYHRYLARQREREFGLQRRSDANAKCQVLFIRPTSELRPSDVR